MTCPRSQSEFIRAQSGAALSDSALLVKSEGPRARPPHCWRFFLKLTYPEAAMTVRIVHWGQRGHIYTGVIYGSHWRLTCFVTKFWLLAVTYIALQQQLTKLNDLKRDLSRQSLLTPTKAVTRK